MAILLSYIVCRESDIYAHAHMHYRFHYKRLREPPENCALILKAITVRQIKLQHNYHSVCMCLLSVGYGLVVEDLVANQEGPNKND